MPYEPSFMSTNTLSASLKKLANNGRPDVEIRLDQHNTSSHTYTTSDSLSGVVSITSPTTAPFDEIHITLEGTSRTFIELMSPVAHQTRQQASHRFLSLAMPIPDSAYPVPRTAEQGMTYTFPFNFVVPSQMLPSSCNHPCTGEEHHVREAHLRLPPSMSGKVSSDDKDDLAPDMAHIGYAIRVRVTKQREHDGKIVALVDKSRPIRIVPAIPESPPLHIGEKDAEYVLKASKVLKKGVFKGKLGTLSLSAAQTKAITTPRSSTESAPTILATLKLRFDPTSHDVKPPRLGSLTSKIRGSTYFSIRAATELLTRPSGLSPYDIYRKVYSETVSLASRCLEAVEWTHHSTSPSYTPYERRDSGYSTCSSSGSSTIVPSVADADTDTSRLTVPGSGSQSWYEASILVPLSLPHNKTWLPTFHSCIISRIYSLDLCITAHTPGTGVPSTSLSLHLPVELISASTQAPVVEFSGLTVEEEVDAHFVPRVLEAINPEFEGRSHSIAFASRNGSVAGPMATGFSVSSEEESGAPRSGSVSGSGRASGPDMDELPGYEAFARGRVIARG